MFKSYLKIAIRNLLKTKVHSLINIFGLAIGLATSILIVLYVVNEWSFDQFHQNKEQIYRVVQTMSSENKVEEQASSPFPLAPVIDAEFPDFVDKSVRFFDLNEASHTFRYKEKGISFSEENFYFVDSTFFDVFNTKLLRGKANDVLKNPLSLVMSEALATKYFGDENPVGKTLNLKGIMDLTVTGVMEEWPEESHLDIELAASFSSLNEIYNSDYDKSWLWNPIWTYVLLKDGVEADNFASQLSTLEDKYYYAYQGWPADEKISLDIQPITDIHLHSSLDNEIKPNGSVFYLYLFSAVAGFTLLIACINFMNLSTARSMERSREVGLRKALGSYREQLFYQFVGESFFISFIAIIVGVSLVVLSLPFFNELVDKQLTFSLLQNWFILPALALLTVVVGFFAGFYPALYLSSYKPVEVLKGTMSKGGNGIAFRKGLVTFQFTLSVLLIIGTAIIFLQLNHMQNKDLGFDKNSVLILPTKQNLIAWKFDAFLEQAKSHSQVESITGLDKIPGSDQQSYYRYVPAKNKEADDAMNLVLHVSHDFTETLDIKMLAGRPFSREYSTDPEQALLINRRMLSTLELDSPEEAIGEIFYYYPPSGERQSFSVVGVVEDFNYTSIKKEIEPLAIRLVDGLRPILRSVQHTAVEIAPGNTTSVLAHLEKVWKEINPIDPFEFSFLDEELGKIYKSEATMNNLSITFSLLCILIACLGLLGLASYSAQLKKQEIGIRKSLGASVADIVMLLSKEFLLLVLIANVIAWPVTYYLASLWLENFPYRIDLLSIIPYIFIGSGFTIVSIALLTVSYHSVKAALINPVNAIRSE
ncbi:MAG: FtsX-like permease family protein [Balneolaceae bacterium]